MTKRRAEGWTPVPHSVLEALAAAPLPGTHRAIVDVIVRELLGWHVRECAIPVRDITERTGGIDARTVRRCLDDLRAWRVLIRRKAGRGVVAVYALGQPHRWSVGVTVAAIRRRQYQQETEGAQLLLPLRGVAYVTPIRPRGRQHRGTRVGAVAPTLRPGPYLPEKKKESSRNAAFAQGPEGDTIPPIRRIEDAPMADPVPTEEERERFRARRAAKFQIQRLTGRRVLSAWSEDPELEALAVKLTPAQIAAELVLHDEEEAAGAAKAQAQRTAESMRHEGGGG